VTRKLKGRRPLNTYQRLDAIRFQAELHPHHGALEAQVAEIDHFSSAGADWPNVEVKVYRPQLSFALTVEFSVFKLTKAVLAFGPDTTGMT
jgi:hypothetical protein